MMMSSWRAGFLSSSFDLRPYYIPKKTYINIKFNFLISYIVEMLVGSLRSFFPGVT